MRLCEAFIEDFPPEDVGIDNSRFTPSPLTREHQEFLAVQRATLNYLDSVGERGDQVVESLFGRQFRAPMRLSAPTTV